MASFREVPASAGSEALGYIDMLIISFIISALSSVAAVSFVHIICMLHRRLYCAVALFRSCAALFGRKDRSCRDTGAVTRDGAAHSPASAPSSTVADTNVVAEPPSSRNSRSAAAPRDGFAAAEHKLRSPSICAPVEARHSHTVYRQPASIDDCNGTSTHEVMALLRQRRKRKGGKTAAVPPVITGVTQTAEKEKHSGSVHEDDEPSTCAPGVYREVRFSGTVEGDRTVRSDRRLADMPISAPVSAQKVPTRNAPSKWFGNLGSPEDYMFNQVDDISPPIAPGARSPSIELNVRVGGGIGFCLISDE